MSGFRFLQVGDTRFGALPQLPERAASARLKQVFLEDRKRLIARVLELARDHQADLVLMPGDILDDARATPEDAEELMLALAELAPRPVVVSPGELDPAHPSGYWYPETLTLLGKAPLPANVHVFRSADAHTLVLGTVAVTGWATPPRLMLVGRSPAAEPGCSGPAAPVAGPAAASATADGGGGTSSTGAAGAPGEQSPDDALRALENATATTHPDQPEWLTGRLPPHVSHRIVVAHQPGPHFAAPPTPAMLAALGVRYMALGHEPEPALMEDDTGSVRLAWAGNPLALQLPGKSGGIVCGVVDIDGQVHAELVELDFRHAHRLACDVNGVLEPGGVVREIALTLERAHVRPQDLVWVRLVGTWVQPVLPRVPSAALGALCMHLSVSIKDLELPLPVGETVRDRHLRGLIPRTPPPRSPSCMEALRLSAAAWDGEEVSASGEDPPDQV